MTPETREKNKERCRKWYCANKARVKNKKAIWHKEHAQEVRNKVKTWRKANPDKHKAASKRYRLKHLVVLRKKEKTRAQRRRHNGCAKESQQKYANNRYHNDNVFKILKILRSRLYAAIRGKTPKSTNTKNLLGCSVEQLMKHIQSHWKPGMSWDNYGFNGWHLDHIRPCASFDLTDPEQQKQCFHWSNLQPLWAKDNFAKGGRYLPDTSSTSALTTSGNAK